MPPAINDASQIRGAFLIEVLITMEHRFFMATLLIGAALVSASAKAGPLATGAGRPLMFAQANIPPTGMGDKDMAMAAAHMAEDERMKHRFPQPIRVGALVGARVSDNDSRTIGTIRQVVRTAQGRIEVVVDCCGWFGFGSRQVAVPIAVLGSLGRQVASLDWPRSKYASAPAWQSASGDAVLSRDDTVQIALARR
jgi:PRC-barrel domain